MTTPTPTPAATVPTESAPDATTTASATQSHVPTTPTPPKSLCYLQAYRQKRTGKITEAEYFHHILQHLSKTRTEHKRDGEWRTDLQDVDPLGYSLSSWILHAESVDDTTPLENVFAAYRTGSIATISAALENVGPSLVEPMRRSLALHALLERNAEVLGWLLSGAGVRYEDTFEDQALFVKKDKDPEVWKVLRESTSFQPRMTWRKKGGAMPFDLR